MKKNTIIVTALLTVMLFGGCGNNNNAQESDSAINAVAEENAQESSENVSESLPEESAENISESDEIAEQDQEIAELADGIYTAEFTTDSSMFRINEAYENKGTLTVENGENDNPYYAHFKEDFKSLSRIGRRCSERRSRTAFTNRRYCHIQ